jgi:hypothetical protein
MPDMRRQQILTVLLFTLLGNSGLACACALISLDAAKHAHHSMPDGHTNDAHANPADCAPACGGHGSTALAGKTSAYPDFQAEKFSAPVLHYEHAAAALIAKAVPPRLQANRYFPQPSSTPVSRSDTLRD